MSIKIKRNTGSFSSFWPFMVQLNGDEVEKLESSQEKELIVEQQHNYLTVKAPLTKSKTIQVKPGDVVQIVDDKLPLYLLWFFLIFLVLFPIFSINLSFANLPFALSLVFLIGISILIFEYFIPYYKLEVTTRELRR